jgi:hypothetical protein
MTNSKGAPMVVGAATSAEQVVQNAAADCCKTADSLTERFRRAE